MAALPNFSVEIWLLILSAVIDMPYVLDTHIHTDVCYWRNRLRDHDIKIYAESERQRKELRLVCRTWKAFSDSNRYRWLFYHSPSRDVANEGKNKDAWDALVEAEKTDPTSSFNRPRRLELDLVDGDDLHFFRRIIHCCSNRITTLILNASLDNADEVLSVFLSAGRHSMPNLRCLMLPAPRVTPTLLRRFSEQFPDVFCLSIGEDDQYPPYQEDILSLPQLEAIDLNLSLYPLATLKKWSLPNLQHLNIALQDSYGQEMPLRFEPLRLFGANLRMLNIYRFPLGPDRNSILLPNEFWCWCPRLQELWVSMSQLLVAREVPPTHPLRYIVHFVNTGFDAHLTTGDVSSELVIAHNLRQVPPNFDTFMIPIPWKVFSDGLAIDNPEQTLLQSLNSVSQAKGFGIQDQDGIALDDFLSIKATTLTDPTDEEADSDGTLD